MQLITPCVLALCLLGSLCLASIPGHVTLEYEHPVPVPNEWKMLGHEPQPTHYVDIIIAIKHSDQSKQALEKLFWDVSDPDKDTYGQYLSLPQLTELMTPPPKRLSVVLDWIMLVGWDKYELSWSQNHDMIAITVPAAKVAETLFVKYFRFEHVETGKQTVASLGPYWVHTELAEHIDFISGVVGLPRVKKDPPHKPFTSDSADKMITPPIVRARYNVTENLINTFKNNSHAVAEFQEQFYSPNDLDAFFQQYVTTGKNYSKIEKVIGENLPSNPGVEAALDVEYIMGVSPNTRTWFISVAPFPFWHDLLKWIAILSNTSDIPVVHTVSYGSQGQYPSEDYRRRFDVEMQKCGVRGLSIIFASGDSGSGCSGCTFYPSFPATNTFVTSVGATRFLQGNSGLEGAVTAYGSGGGFSQLFDMPTYQHAAVKEYFRVAKSLPPSRAYNANGRATPDVAALGDVQFAVLIQGQTILVGGTSASAPSFGAIVTFLNQIRMQKGKSPLGFLNPWLYKTAARYPNAFFDVTVGDNIVEGCCPNNGGGFVCAPGWDPVTGVGTPNFEVLQTLV